MANTIAERLAERGIDLPQAAAPAANYVAWVIAGDMLYISGQLPLENGHLAYTGHLGHDHKVLAGQAAAELCAINVLAQAKSALGGDLERIVQLVRITGYVASTPDFVEQHLVVNGASDLFAAILGDKGKHARAAIGTASLPLNAAVEVDAIFQIA
jgi:enamine deaminase RidA (YjgF/YER057c/UK114 family)